MSLSDIPNSGSSVGAALAAPLSERESAWGSLVGAGPQAPLAGGRRTDSGDRCMTEPNNFGEDQE